MSMIYNTYQQFFKTIFYLSKTHIIHLNQSQEHNLVFLANHPRMIAGGYPQLNSLHNPEMVHIHL